MEEHGQVSYVTARQLTKYMHAADTLTVLRKAFPGLIILPCLPLLLALICSDTLPNAGQWPGRANQAASRLNSRRGTIQLLSAGIPAQPNPVRCCCCRSVNVVV